MKTKNPQYSKMWLAVAFSVVMLLIFIGLFVNYRAGTGRAIYIGEEPYTGGVVNLMLEEFITYTVLPEEEDTIQFNLSLAPNVQPVVTETYELVLTKLDSLSYKVSFRKITPTLENKPFLRDLIQRGETVSLYLDTTNTVPDLEISFSNNNQITIKNLHYIQPDVVRIQLLQSLGTVATGSTPAVEAVEYPHIIRLPAPTASTSASSFIAWINASSSIQPALQADILTSTGQPLPPPTTPMPTLVIPPETGPVSNEILLVGQVNRYILQSLSWPITLPTGVPAISRILNITAIVQGQRTSEYYTLAINNRVYELNQANFPNMNVDFTTATGAAARITVTLAATTELQPLAFPCKLANNNIATVFGTTIVKQVYSYSSTGAQVWNRVGGQDFTTFTDYFGGYFVRLENAYATTPSSLQFTIDCTMESFLPGDDETHTFPSGWSMFSLPGTVPRSLRDFTTSEDFHLFECRQNYQCSEIVATTPLQPGKVYWISTETPVLISYKLE